MHFQRTIFLFAMAGLFGITGGATAQQSIEKLLEPYKEEFKVPPRSPETEMREFRDLKKLLKSPTPGDLATLKTMAEYLVHRIVLPEYHTFIKEGVELKARPNTTVEKLLEEARQYVMKPDAPGAMTPNYNKEAYIREFGAAFDKTVLAILAKNPPPTLRIAAMRMLVVACESGAPAHWITVGKMLADPKTQPDVLIYAIRAAEALLATYDQERFFALNGNGKIADAQKQIVEFVNALNGIVLKGPPLLDRVYIPSEGVVEIVNDPKKPVEPNKLTPEQIAVYQYYRLHAIKALAKLKVEVVGGGIEEARPLYTLARVAVGDPTLTPSLTNKEIGEAILGLVNVVPTKTVNVEVQSYALAFGISYFMTPKSNNGEDNSVAWKGIASKMQTGLKDWNSGVQKSPIAQAAAKKAVSDLVTNCDTNVFTPLLKAGVPGGFNPLGIGAWTGANPVAGSHELYTGRKDSLLKYAGSK